MHLIDFYPSNPIITHVLSLHPHSSITTHTTLTTTASPTLSNMGTPYNTDQPPSPSNLRPTPSFCPCKSLTSLSLSCSRWPCVLLTINAFVFLCVGCQLCMGHAVDQNLLSLVHQDMKELIKKYKKTEAEQAAFQVSLDQLGKEQREMQTAFSSLQDQQSSTSL